MFSKKDFLFKVYSKNFNKSFFKISPFLKNLLLKNKKLNYLNLYLKPHHLISFKKINKNFHRVNKTLSLNFKRNRFFPNIRTLKGENYIFASLGMFVKYFSKQKSFLKSKTMYLILASFFRKILIFSKFKNLILTISRIPVFLKEIISTINDPVVNIYKNPFHNSLINEKNNLNKFKFSLIMFLNNKSFSKIKLKKKGRLKRKITKKITLSNRLID